MKMPSLPLVLFVSTLIVLALVPLLSRRSLPPPLIEKAASPISKSLNPGGSLKDSSHRSPERNQHTELKTSQSSGENAASSSQTQQNSGGAAAQDSSVRMIVYLAVLGASLFIILSKKYNADDKKWAYGTVGAILGYYLKGG